jgi:hypothetical protein
MNNGYDRTCRVTQHGWNHRSNDWRNIHFRSLDFCWQQYSDMCIVQRLRSTIVFDTCELKSYPTNHISTRRQAINYALIMSLQVHSFNRSIVLLNHSHQMIDRAVRRHLLSVFTDCPHRGKLGWLEESHLVFLAMQHFFDVQARGRSAVCCIAAAQLNIDMIPSNAPDFLSFNDIAWWTELGQWHEPSAVVLVSVVRWDSSTRIVLYKYGCMAGWFDVRSQWSYCILWSCRLTHRRSADNSGCQRKDWRRMPMS